MTGLLMIAVLCVLCTSGFLWILQEIWHEDSLPWLDDDEYPPEEEGHSRRNRPRQTDA